MTAFQDQGEGEIVPGLGFAVVQILVARNTTPTRISLRSGEAFLAQSVRYGRDIGADWEHIYFDVDGQPYFLNTSEIITLAAPESGALLYERKAQ